MDIKVEEPLIISPKIESYLVKYLAKTEFHPLKWMIDTRLGLQKSKCIFIFTIITDI